MPQQRRKTRFGIGSPLEGCYNTPARLRDIAGDKVPKAIRTSERTSEKNSFTMSVPTGSELRDIKALIKDMEIAMADGDLVGNSRNFVAYAKDIGDSVECLQTLNMIQDTNFDELWSEFASRPGIDPLLAYIITCWRIKSGLEGHLTLKVKEFKNNTHRGQRDINKLTTGSYARLQRPIASQRLGPSARLSRHPFSSLPKVNSSQRHIASSSHGQLQRPPQRGHTRPRAEDTRPLIDTLIGSATLISLSRKGVLHGPQTTQPLPKPTSFACYLLLPGSLSAPRGGVESGILPSTPTSTSDGLRPPHHRPPHSRAASRLPASRSPAHPRLAPGSPPPRRRHVAEAFPSVLSKGNRLHIDPFREQLTELLHIAVFTGLD